MAKTPKTDNNKNNPSKFTKTEICKNLVDRITCRRTFEPLDRPAIGCRFYRFRHRGESIVGVLGFPVKNYRQGTSYPLQLEDGEIVEIVGNKLLHKQIKEGELCGQYVEIVYQGREFLAGGHHRKIYRVFKIDRPGLPREFWDQLAKKGEKLCQKKNTVRAVAMG